MEYASNPRFKIQEQVLPRILNPKAYSNVLKTYSN